MAPRLFWTFNPGVLIALAAVGGAYLRRWWHVRTGPSPLRTSEAPVWRLCCMLAALLLSVIALVSGEGHAIGDAMQAAFAREAIDSDVFQLGISTRGATVEPLAAAGRKTGRRTRV